MSETAKVETIPREIPVQYAPARSSKWKSKVSGMIPAEDIWIRYVIPQRDHRSRTGYQRELSTSRVNRLVKELREDRVDLPTSILVNLRNYDEDRDLRDS